MKAIVAVLPGDAGGSEVTTQAARVLEAVGERFGHELQIETGLYGGLAINACGDPLPPQTLALARRSDALLLGGGASGRRWEDPRLSVHPAQALLKLRQELGLYANLRPVRLYPELVHMSTLKPDVVQGVDLLLVREVASGIYFGRPRRQWQTTRGRNALDTTVYREREIERVLRLAFEIASTRRRHLTSVDKANVLATSKLWREIANELAREYPEVELEHVLVDNCAVHLLTEPRRFDVIVAENLFGYILQDVAGALTGSLGMLPGGTLGPPRNARGRPAGLYEPTRGTTPPPRPEMANPVGAILSAAMLLRHSLGVEAEARVIEDAVAGAVRSGRRTADMSPGRAPVMSAAAMGDAILEQLEVAAMKNPSA
ncbi:MAG: 3-isopropylmalate dehydrogenase [Deltaproteobacteria bacterium]|nr:3-isopropylmalate dehydrogenase [Deltaproteobacteria bacterium]